MDGSRQRPSAVGGKKTGHRFSKKHTSSDIKKSRSSPSHLATAVEDERDPDSYQTISIQVVLSLVSVNTIILAHCLTMALVVARWVWHYF